MRLMQILAQNRSSLHYKYSVKAVNPQDRHTMAIENNLELDN